MATRTEPTPTAKKAEPISRVIKILQMAADGGGTVSHGDLDSRFYSNRLWQDIANMLFNKWLTQDMGRGTFTITDCGRDVLARARRL